MRDHEAAAPPAAGAGARALLSKRQAADVWDEDSARWAPRSGGHRALKTQAYRAYP